jgi:hypothetical protein
VVGVQVRPVQAQGGEEGMQFFLRPATRSWLGNRSAVPARASAVIAATVPWP